MNLLPMALSLRYLVCRTFLTVADVTEEDAEKASRKRWSITQLITNWMQEEEVTCLCHTLHSFTSSSRKRSGRFPQSASDALAPPLAAAQVASALPTSPLADERRRMQSLGQAPQHISVQIATVRILVGSGCHKSCQLRCRTQRMMQR